MAEPVLIGEAISTWLDELLPPRERAWELSVLSASERRQLYRLARLTPRQALEYEARLTSPAVAPGPAKQPVERPEFARTGSVSVGPAVATGALP